VAEAVSACALALFRLVGAFHGSRAHCGTDPQYTQRLGPYRRDFGAAVFPALCVNAPRALPFGQRGR
jgi:hypothetical protein